MNQSLHADEARLLYAELRELAAGSFPRRCGCCGREYADPQQWLAETQPVPRGSGLKAAADEQGAAVVVELFRTCSCGSTLMETFDDRRDMSEAGERRRRYFGRMLEVLVQRGLRRDEARRELLAARRGRLSERLRTLLESGARRVD
jgi:hypothetical protein